LPVSTIAFTAVTRRVSALGQAGGLEAVDDPCHLPSSVARSSGGTAGRRGRHDSLARDVPAQRAVGVAGRVAAYDELGGVRRASTPTRRPARTGLNTHRDFAEKVRDLLADDSGLDVRAPEDPFEAQGNRDALVELSGVLKVLAVSMTKIANDLAMMGSGPRAGIGELYLPELLKGSSIMPGKVNPVIPEVVMQVGAQVIGNDAAITVGGLQGNFELNVRIPLIARNLLSSIHLLTTTSTLFAQKCVQGIEPNHEGCERSAEGTLAVATALNPYIGYDKAAEIVKAASASGRTLREVAREHGVEDFTLDEALDLRRIAAWATAPRRWVVPYMSW
jgi:aspartate ammonia-lyase